MRGLVCEDRVKNEGEAFAERTVIFIFSLCKDGYASIWLLEFGLRQYRLSLPSGSLEMEHNGFDHECRDRLKGRDCVPPVAKMSPH